MKHCFSFCPRYAAQRNLLLTSAANILGDTCSSSSDAKKLNFLLYGVKSVNYEINCALFREVQTFIINSGEHICKYVNLFVVILCAVCFLFFYCLIIVLL